MGEDRQEEPGEAPGPVVEWDEEEEEEVVQGAAAEAVQGAAVEAVGQVWETVPAQAPVETAFVLPAGQRLPTRPVCPAIR